VKAATPAESSASPSATHTHKKKSHKKAHRHRLHRHRLSGSKKAKKTAVPTPTETPNSATV
jgi:hypothetical protein